MCSENSSMMLPPLDSKLATTGSPRLTPRARSVAGHVYLAPHVCADRAVGGQGLKQRISLEQDIRNLNRGDPHSPADSSKTLSDHGHRQSVERQISEPSDHLRSRLSGSRSGSPHSRYSGNNASPASTPGLRRRKVENKISPLVGDSKDLCGSVPDLRSRAKTFYDIKVQHQNQGSVTFRSNLVTSASRDSLDVGLSRLDVTDNVVHTERLSQVPSGSGHHDVPADTLEKCQRWLAGVAKAKELERPLDTVLSNTVEWSD